MSDERVEYQGRGMDGRDSSNRSGGLRTLRSPACALRRASIFGRVVKIFD